MKKIISTILALLVLASAAPALAKTTPVTSAKKSKVVSVKVTKKSLALANKKKPAKKTVLKVRHVSTFSAAVAAQSVSKNGSKPPAGYMQALNRALDKYLAAKAAARGNAAKLKVASDNYDADLSDAQSLLNQQ